MQLDPVQGPCERYSELEAKAAILKAKLGKAAGPSEVVSDMLKASDSDGV